jgi:hypothetical protein
MTIEYKTVVEYQKGTHHSEDFSINGRTILKCIFKETGCVGVD